MKVFNNDRDETVRFRIEPRIGDDGIYLELKENGNRATTVFPPSDAPALALAILEAAGFEAEFHATGTFQDGDCWQLENVAQVIKDYLSIKDAEAAEAKDKAELEAEALELFNVRHGTDLDDWKHSDRSVASAWVSVARKAREIGAKK